MCGKTWLQRNEDELGHIHVRAVRFSNEDLHQLHLGFPPHCDRQHRWPFTSRSPCLAFFYTLNSVTESGHVKYKKSTYPCAIPEVKHMTSSRLNLKKGTELAPHLASTRNTIESVHWWYMSKITRTQNLGVSRWRATSCATSGPGSWLGGVPRGLGYPESCLVRVPKARHDWGPSPSFARPFSLKIPCSTLFCLLPPNFYPSKPLIPTPLYRDGKFWVAPPGHTQFFALCISWRRWHWLGDLH